MTTKNLNMDIFELKLIAQNRNRNQLKLTNTMQDLNDRFNQISLVMNHYDDWIRSFNRSIWYCNLSGILIKDLLKYNREIPSIYIDNIPMSLQSENLSIGEFRIYPCGHCFDNQVLFQKARQQLVINTGVGMDTDDDIYDRIIELITKCILCGQNPQNTSNHQKISQQFSRYFVQNKYVPCQYLGGITHHLETGDIIASDSTIICLYKGNHSFTQMQTDSFGLPKLPLDAVKLRGYWFYLLNCPSICYGQIPFDNGVSTVIDNNGQITFTDIDRDLNLEKTSRLPFSNAEQALKLLKSGFLLTFRLSETEYLIFRDGKLMIRSGCDTYIIRSYYE
jgi:hypothetical protein